ncbi:MAG: hypothetical protein IKN27_08385 [Selenomonadaceae bacterium]|nr:hypothetical protein [Selenomonadaceae bacterium]
MQKFFVINFDDGFDLTDRLERVQFDLKTFPGIEIQTVPDSWSAYRIACLKHTAKKLNHSPFVMPTLPRFEDVMPSPFYERIPQLPPTRYFAMATSDYHATIATDVSTVLNFLDSFNAPFVKEFTNYDAALYWINRIFTLPIIAMGAYLTADIPLIDGLDDKVTLLPYQSWLEKNCSLAPEQLFTPQNCVAQSDEQNFTLPLDLIELPPPK